MLQRRTACSEKLSELDGVHEFNLRLAGVHNALGARLHVDALHINTVAGGLGVSLGLVVGAHAGLEGFAAGGHAGVLHTDVDALRDDAASDALVDDDADSVLGHVPHLAGLAVVELVGHTSVDGAVSDHVNIVAHLVRNEVLAQGRGSVLSERLAEEMSRASSETEVVGHLSFKPSKYLILICDIS